ncbi:hypothetical protein RhiJN_07882 [Ceratobasidium sp. AG-Ba]|nr:hypothetical protein RhiJN_07882 [Ceratobasidium sp. AG-Ba]
MPGPATRQSNAASKRKSRPSSMSQPSSGTGKKRRTRLNDDDNNDQDGSDAVLSKSNNTRGTKLAPGDFSDNNNDNDSQNTNDGDSHTKKPPNKPSSHKQPLSPKQAQKNRKNRELWRLKEKARKASFLDMSLSRYLLTPRYVGFSDFPREIYFTVNQTAPGSPNTKRNRTEPASNSDNNDDSSNAEDGVATPIQRQPRNKGSGSEAASNRGSQEEGEDKNYRGKGDGNQSEEEEEPEEEEEEGKEANQDQGPSNKRPNSSKSGRGARNRQQSPEPRASGEEAESEEDESPPLENKDGLLLRWFGRLVNNRERLLAISKAHERVAREVRAAHIGDAAILFAGVGDVESAVDLSDDPNKLGNPCGVYQDHVQNIYNVIRRPGSKKDHEAPILLLVDGRLVGSAMREAMKLVRAEEPLDIMTILVLNNVTAKEDAIEREAWYEQRGDEWLTPDQLLGLRAELDGLRSNRPRATLLNGRHRILAMLLLAQELQVEREDICKCMVEGTSDEHELFARLAQWEQHALTDLAWRVKVYDSNLLSEDAKNFLVNNDHERPAKDAGVSEKLWWLANKLEIETLARQNTEFDGRTLTRAEAMNMVHAKWLEDLQQTPGTIEDMIATADKPKGKKLGDKASSDNSTRLFFNSVTTEMVFNTRHAMWAFESALDKKAAVMMLQPQGAAVVAHFWMALRTLLSVFDCAKGTGLTDAEQWLDCHPDLSTDGHQEAEQHYDALHSAPKRVPQLLPLYNKTRATQFWNLYDQEFSRFIATGFVNYASEDVILAFRKVFDAFGKLLSGRDENLRRRGAETPDCLTVLEGLLERGQLIWTMGARGTSASCNWNNWYYRPRGLHQIILRIYENTQIGTVEARLSESGKLSLHQAVEAFSARKSGRHTYPGFLNLTEAFEQHHGTEKEIVVALPNLRLAIKNGVRALRALQPEAVATQANKIWQDIITNHPISALLDPSHGDQAFPEFYTGWKDKLKRLPLTAGMGVGWGLLEHWFNEVKLHEVFDSEAARWILVVADQVLELTGGPMWWDFEIPSEEELPIPDELPQYLLTYSKRGMRQLKAQQQRDEKERVAAEAALQNSKKSKKAPAKSKKPSQQSSGSAGPSGRRMSQRLAGQGKGAKDGGKNPSQSNQPKSKELIDSSDKEPAVGEDGDEDKEHEGEDERPKKPTATAQGPRSASLLSNEPLFGPNSDVREFTDMKETATEWLLRPKLPRREGADWPEPPDGYNYYHEAVNKLPLAAHITAPRLGSLKLPHHVWSRILAVWINFDPNTLELADISTYFDRALLFNSETCSGILRHFSRAQNRFRIAVV